MNKRLLLFLFALLWFLPAGNCHAADAYFPIKEKHGSCLFITSEPQLPHFSPGQDFQEEKPHLQKKIRTKAWYNDLDVDVPSCWEQVTQLFCAKRIYNERLQAATCFRHPHSHHLRGPPEYTIA